MKSTPYYADFDEKYEVWCVFSTERGSFAFASFSDESEAKAYAKERNAGHNGKEESSTA